MEFQLEDSGIIVKFPNPRPVIPSTFTDVAKDLDSVVGLTETAGSNGQSIPVLVLEQPDSFLLYDPAAGQLQAKSQTDILFDISEELASEVLDKSSAADIEYVEVSLAIVGQSPEVDAFEFLRTDESIPHDEEVAEFLDEEETIATQIRYMNRLDETPRNLKQTIPLKEIRIGPYSENTNNFWINIIFRTSSFSETSSLLDGYKSRLEDLLDGSSD